MRKIENFFPVELCDALVLLIEGMVERKLEFSLSTAERASCPPAVGQAVAFVERRTGLSFNRCVLKIYKLGELHQSGAYQWHIDPESYHPSPLFHCTLRGEANFFYKNGQGEICRVEYQANTAIILDSKLAHYVSAPTSENGERLYIFFGYFSK